MKRTYRIGMWIAAATALALLAAPALVEQVTYTAEKARIKALRETLATLSKTDTLSPLFNTVARSIRPALVEVRVMRKIVAVPRARAGEDRPPRSLYHRSQGSGVILDAENGYVMTNRHVILMGDEVKVVLHDGRVLPVLRVWEDAKTDLAVLQIPSEGLIAAPLGDSDTARAGHWVLAFGAPMGLTQSMTAGIVSARGRNPSPVMYQDYIQTDAAINRGNSGGPLVNTRGEVIGINTVIFSQTGEYAGVCMAIPSNLARYVMRQLIRDGRVTRGFLAVHIQDISPELAATFGLNTSRGALVTEVLPGGPADKAGIGPEDFIVEINGKAVIDVSGLRNIVAAIPPGTEAAVVFYRDGTRKSAKAVIAALPEEAPTSRPAQNGRTPTTRPGDLGLTLTPITKELLRTRHLPVKNGLLVTEVAPDTPAGAAGIKRGAIITHVGTTPVRSEADFNTAITAAQSRKDPGVRLRVANAFGGRWYIFLPLR